MHRKHQKAIPPLTQRQKRWTRDGFTYFLGIAGIVNEAFIRNEKPRDALLILFGSMIGLPTIIRLNEKRNDSS